MTKHDPEKVREVINDIQGSIDSYWSDASPFDNEKVYWNRQQVLVNAAKAWLAAQDNNGWMPDEMDISRVVVNALRNGGTPTQTVKNIVSAVMSLLPPPPALDKGE